MLSRRKGKRETGKDGQKTNHWLQSLGPVSLFPRLVMDYEPVGMFVESGVPTDIVLSSCRLNLERGGLLPEQLNPRSLPPLNINPTKSPENHHGLLPFKFSE